MRARIDATAFNGRPVSCEVDLHVEQLSFVNGGADEETLSRNVRGRVREKVLGLLQKVLPDQPLLEVHYRLVSRGLEELRANRVEPDPDSLANQVSRAVFLAMLDRLGLEPEAQIEILRERRDLFARVFLDDRDARVRQEVRRLMELHRERRFDGAHRLLEQLDDESLSAAERELVRPLALDLALRRADCRTEEMEATFERYRQVNREHPLVMKQGYLHMIRAMEDCRDPLAPRRYLEEFEANYPLSLLSPDERRRYRYHRGRTEYGRGEYIGALELLEQAVIDLPAGERQLRAAVDTVAANCLADNLFFDEGEQLARNALEDRLALELADAFESRGCLAGISFRRGDFEAAREGFLDYAKLAGDLKLSAGERNRLHNYLAKAAIMLDDDREAERQLALAEEAGDRLGFSAALRLLLLLRHRRYAEMDELYALRCLLPEQQRSFDRFALGWCHAFMARAEFERESFDAGVDRLFRAVGCFREDLYHMEAAWVLRYLREYPLPREALELFERICSIDEVLDDFAAFVARHADLPQRFARLLPGKEGPAVEAGEPLLSRLLSELRDLLAMRSREDGFPLLGRLCLY